MVPCAAISVFLAVICSSAASAIPHLYHVLTSYPYLPSEDVQSTALIKANTTLVKLTGVPPICPDVVYVSTWATKQFYRKRFFGSLSASMNPRTSKHRRDGRYGGMSLFIFAAKVRVESKDQSCKGSGDALITQRVTRHEIGIYTFAAKNRYAGALPQPDAQGTISFQTNCSNQAYKSVEIAIVSPSNVQSYYHDVLFNTDGRTHWWEDKRLSWYVQTTARSARKCSDDTFHSCFLTLWSSECMRRACCTLYPINKL